MILADKDFRLKIGYFNRTLKQFDRIIFRGILFCISFMVHHDVQPWVERARHHAIILYVLTLSSSCNFCFQLWTTHFFIRTMSVTRYPQGEYTLHSTTMANLQLKQTPLKAKLVASLLNCRCIKVFTGIPFAATDELINRRKKSMLENCFKEYEYLISFLLMALNIFGRFRGKGICLSYWFQCAGTLYSLGYECLEVKALLEAFWSTIQTIQLIQR